MAIWNSLKTACAANERLLTKLDQPCFYNGWRQIGNPFRWLGILIPVLQTLVFFQMCMQKLFIVSLSPPLSPINPRAAMAREFNYSRQVSSHFRQNALSTKASTNFPRKVEHDQKVSYHQSCQISINSQLMLAKINSY